MKYRILDAWFMRWLANRAARKYRSKVTKQAKQKIANIIYKAAKHGRFETTEYRSFLEGVMTDEEFKTVLDYFRSVGYNITELPPEGYTIKINWEKNNVRNQETTKTN